MKKMTAIMMLAMGFLLVGCNTMSGFGKDVSKAGDKIEDKADKDKKY